MDCSSRSEAPVTWHGHGGDARVGEAMRGLPLAILYLTERCNSRCISCDYWRHGRRDMSAAQVARWLPGFASLGTQVILVSGGEPLLNPEWAAIARLLRSRGLRLWLLTAGLALAKHAREVGELFESVTVSLDGVERAGYAAIRGVDAFDKVCEGIRAAVAQGTRVLLRVTVQRANHRELPRFVALAHELGVAGLSFLAADVASVQAFGRQAAQDIDGDIALRPEDLPALAAALDVLERAHAEDFRSGFILDSVARLRRLEAHCRAACGLGEYPEVRCNAPEFSAVIEAGGAVRPCFFIPGTVSLDVADSDLAGALDSPAMRRLRADIRGRARPECARCVCAKWRDPAATGAWA